MNLSRLFSARQWLMLMTLWLSVVPAGFAAAAMPTNALAPYDYAEPRLLTGTIYETGSKQKQVLFTFRRTATRSGSTVHVEREFLCPDGSTAAVENVVYESDRLVSCRMQEFQANVSGDIKIAPDPKKPAQQKLFISYGHGQEPRKTDDQNLPTNTVIADNLYPFMLAHWDDLMRGNSVKFRFVSLEWQRTFMFRLVKTGESVQAGRTVEKIRMEPTNLFVARLMDPLNFIVEKDGAHHIISYVGRTTPRIKKGKAWKYLDAETVFDWK